MQNLTLKDIKDRCDVDTASGCWLWKNCVQKDSGGRVRSGGKTWHVRRLSYTLATGDIRAGFDVRNDCDSQLCCNPDHLECLSKKMRVRRMVAAGRHSCGARHSLAVRESSRACHGKLSMEEARRIRQRSTAGESPFTLAEELKVHVTTIRLVVAGKIWKENKGIFDI